jgi:hypothetical protein
MRVPVPMFQTKNFKCCSIVILVAYFGGGNFKGPAVGPSLAIGKESRIWARIIISYR